MNGELAQRIALVAYGNEFLAGHQRRDVESTTTFQYVHSLQFTLGARSPLRRSSSVSTVRGWFDQLARRGVHRLELDCIGQSQRRVNQPLPEHIAVAFVSGEHSAILGQRSRKTEVWRASWDVTPGERPANNRIWDVRYEGEEATPIALVHPTIDDATDVLGRGLADAERFARANDAGHWPDWLAAARQQLSADEPEIPYHPDLVPEEVGVQRSRVLAAAVKGYIFGGMGSWNDMGFGDAAVEAEYMAVTKQLYQAVMYALDAAVNGADDG